MSVYNYYVGVGLDPIRFGMPRDEVISILGKPQQTLKFSPEGSSDPSINAVIENSGVEGVQKALSNIFEGQVTDIYNDGNRDGDVGMSAYNYISEVTYVGGTVSQIVVLDCKKAIDLEGVNLCSEEIYDVLEHLHGKSGEMYYESTYVYFPELGVKMSDDPDAQRAVFLVDGRTEEALMKGGDYKFISDEDFSEFYGEDPE